MHLNVWRPQDANENSALAVMFWIHGGGFTGGAGSAPKFNGAYMAKTQNVVVVTMYVGTAQPRVMYQVTRMPDALAATIVSAQLAFSCRTAPELAA